MSSRKVVRGSSLRQLMILLMMSVLMITSRLVVMMATIHDAV